MTNKNSACSDAPDYDVLVIGGGPAGSCVSSLLAKRGWRVGLVDKDIHPRFHIGESLLPMNMPLLKELGVYHQVEAIGVKKNGVDFHTKNSLENPDLQILFKDSLCGEPPSAFQVLRSEFDHILLQNAGKLGVDVYEGHKVTDVNFSNLNAIQIKASGPNDSEYLKTAAFVIDASGRDTFLSKKMKLKQRSPKHNDAAIFAHFENVDRPVGDQAGHIGLHWFDHGWIWRIPLNDGVTSIGAVARPEFLKSRQDNIETALLDIMASCPSLAAKMQTARLKGKVQGTGNYSYQSRKSHGDGFLMIGDAMAFVDPVFSSGVYIAMNSAQRAIPLIEAHLKKEDNIAALQRDFDTKTIKGISRFTWFIYRYTSPGLMRLFISGQKMTHIKRAVISVLAGDVFDNSEIEQPLSRFKILYKIFSLLSPIATFRHFNARKRDLDIQINQ